MFFQDIETSDIYRLLSKDDDIVYLECRDHNIFKFDLDFFNKNFTQLKLVKNGNN